MDVQTASTFNATGATFTSLDTLTGTAGATNNTLNIVDSTGGLAAGAPSAVQLNNIQKVTLTSSGKIGTPSGAGSAESIALSYAGSTSSATSVITINGVALIATAAATDADGAASAAAAVTALTAIYKSLGYSVVATPTSASQIKIASAATTVSGVTTTAVTVTGFAGADIPNPSITSPSNLTQLPSVTNTAAVAGATAVAYDLSDTTAFGSVTEVAATSIGGANINATGTAAVSVSNSSGVAVKVAGGLTQSLTTDFGTVTSTGSKGAVVINEAAQSSSLISVDGGTNVTITTKATTGAVTVGGNAAGALSAASLPTGVITVGQTVSGSSSAARAGGAVTTSGGTSVVITETASQPSPSSLSTTAYTTTLGGASVTGGAATTSVTVNQSAPATAVNYVAAVTGVKESVSVKFAALAAGQYATVDDLTFTAGTNGATAAQVASAFANLAKGAKAGVSGFGTYTGVLATTTATSDNFTSGAANADTVTFTSATATSNGLVLGGTNAATTPVGTEVAGYKAAVIGVGKGGVANGAVIVTDVNGGSASTKVGTIAAVTASNFTTLSISDNALTSLTVTGGQGNIIIDNSSALLDASKTKTLGLTIGGQTGGTLDDADIYTTLNVTTTANSYLANVTFGGATALNVTGTSALGLDSVSGLTALKAITVSGSAGLSDYTTGTFNSDGSGRYLTTSLDLSGLASLTSVDASGTTGVVKATVLASQTSFTGGSGADSVSVAAAAGVTTVSKAISTGAGNDTVTLADAATLTISNNINGGDGTDTLGISARDAAAVLSGGAVFKSYVSGFETLKITGDSGSAVATNTTVVLSDLGVTSSVNVAEAVNSGVTLTLDKFADAGTLTISANQSGTVALTNATAWATSTSGTPVSYAANSVNIVVTGTSADTYTAGTGAVSGAPTLGSITGGTVSFTKVGTVNLTATDAGSTSIGTVASHTLTVTDAEAYALNANGNANLTLTLGTSTAPKTINASAMTGAFTVTAAAVTGGSVVTGGSGNDSLTASSGTGADQLIGGAGNDTLTANGGADTLTGGAGSDTFIVATPSAAKTIYSTITDFSSGDCLTLRDMTGTEAFTATKVDLSALAATATLSDAINTSIRGAASAEIRWFQFGGNTYVIESASAHTPTTDFADASDLVVQLTGLIDLSGAGFNSGAWSLYV